MPTAEGSVDDEAVANFMWEVQETYTTGGWRPSYFQTIRLGTHGFPNCCCPIAASVVRRPEISIQVEANLHVSISTVAKKAVEVYGLPMEFLGAFLWHWDHGDIPEKFSTTEAEKRGYAAALQLKEMFPRT